MAELNRDAFDTWEELTVENDLKDFNKDVQRSMIMSGYLYPRLVDDIVAFEVNRQVASGAAEADAERLAIDSLRDHAKRADAIKALRAEKPEAFIAPAGPKDDWLAQYKKITHKQAKLKNGAGKMSRILTGIETSQAKRAARKGK